MKSLCIIQARVGSQRLPRKVLEEIEGMALIGRVIERVSRSSAVDEIVLATSTKKEDIALVEAAASAGVDCFQGSDEDVLDRFVQATRKFGGDVVLRITGDCPLQEPSVIDDVVALYRERPADYIYIQNYPRGTGDVELMTPGALEQAWEVTNEEDRFYREHVMPYIVENPGKFRVRVEEAPEAFRRPELRVCVDEEADLKLVREIYRHFAPRTDFSLAEMIAFLEGHADVANINAAVHQREAVLARPRIAFRTDGGNDIGMGHVVRCGALVAAFKSLTDCEVHFMTTSPHLVADAAPNFVQVHEVSPTCSGAEELELWPSRVGEVDALIVDLPRVDSTYAEALGEHAGLLVQISDENDSAPTADLLINPNLTHDAHARPQGTYLGGRDAIILRDQFLLHANEERTIRTRVAKLFLCFGGSDPGRLTERLLHVMEGIDLENVEILAAIGGAQSDRREIEAVVRAMPGCRAISELEDVAEVMWTADLAIISGGTLMYEACALGTPAVVVSQNAEQDREAQYFAEQGAVVNLGEHNSVTDEGIQEAVSELMGQADARTRLSENARVLIDPSATNRVATFVLSEITRRRR